MKLLKNSIVPATAMVASLFVPQSHAALERFGDFALLDESGEFHQISRYQHRRAVVMLAYDPACAALDESVSALTALQNKYSAQDVEFLILDTSASSRETVQSWNLPMPVLKDAGKLISASLQIGTAGEVLMMNPERLSVFYRGAVNDTLDTTIHTALSEGLRDTVTTSPLGCELQFADRERIIASPPDYTTEIAPIIIDNCSECHRWGGAGPFALDSYTSLLGWSPMIREVLLNKRMPPMQVDPEIGHTESATQISTEKIQTLVHWMDAGAPRGDNPLDPLAEVPIEKIFEWQLGEPDYIVEATPNAIPAVGIQDYLYTETTLPFDRDMWVRAFQYNPEKETVLHHLMTFVSPPDEGFWGEEADNEIATRRFLGSFIPGDNPATVFSEDTGVLIPQGHKLSMQFHYVTNGVATTDNTEIGLYFYDTPPANELLTKAISPRFVIQPNEQNLPMHGSYQFDKPVVVTSVRTRMNFRGKKMKFIAEDPAGNKYPLLSIPAYNYGWQPHYRLSSPVALEAGATIHIEGAFDNSLSNPFNPDPTIEVGFGLQSYDEMFTGYITYYENAK